MVHSPNRNPRATTWDELAALNHEIAALIRAGLPLEEGLQQTVRRLGSGGGELRQRIQQAAESGSSIVDILQAEGNSVSPMYLAVVAAGLRTGKLADALERFAEAATHAGQLRRIAAQALAYPAIVLLVAWLLVLAIATARLPASVVGDVDDSPASLLRIDATTAIVLAIATTAGLAVAALLWWKRTSLPSLHGRGWLSRFDWIPGRRRSAKLCNDAAFAEMLQLLISVDTPLAEAMQLTGETCQSPSMRRASAQLAAALARGESIASQRALLNQLPPLVRTALLCHSGKQSLERSLQRASRVYRERAESWTTLMGVAFPLAATVFLGGAIVGCYAAFVLQPYFAALDQFSADAIDATQGAYHVR